MKLKTDYIVGDIPHSEHPNPQFERDGVKVLNGKWNLKKLNANGLEVFNGKILVPFSPESINSGVVDDFVLNANETLVYNLIFTLDNNFIKGRTLLHFGAVDSECEVILNGESVGSHVGGFTPFTLDVTSNIKTGENNLIVKCTDEATRNGGARGKQNDKRGGIWYTAQSGIWQTVWLETMPSNYIPNVKILPLSDLKSVKISTVTPCNNVKITVFDGENAIITTTFDNEVVLNYNFIPWSPENPKLYNFTLENAFGDKVNSYFGVRTFTKVYDEKGKLRLALNGKPYFMNGLLDQGYWSDGLLTHPSDEAIITELETIKKMGFNTLRKHIKLEPMRWYYHCDRLGIIVWQDFVNGGDEYKFTNVALWPFLGFNHKDTDYKYFGRTDKRAREEFETSVEETISVLYNVVSLGVWVVFNEGWGQFDSKYFTNKVKTLDDSRIIDSVSGWHDQGEKETELRSIHNYYLPLTVPKDRRAVVLSEFGGYSLKLEGHVTSMGEFGYKKFKSKEDLTKAIKVLFLNKIKPLIQKGLSACIYTQVSDVEDEINGLFTYDRKVTKIPVDVMAEINNELYEESLKIK
ncbi:MAG: glycoside hydrolase family 2 [Clostridia bacterium]|nr:glycoside hydrolase family 2 [Clostridia bacterium]